MSKIGESETPSSMHTINVGAQKQLQTSSKYIEIRNRLCEYGVICSVHEKVVFFFCCLVEVIFIFWCLKETTKYQYRGRACMAMRLELEWEGAYAGAECGLWRSVYFFPRSICMSLDACGMREQEAAAGEVEDEVAAVVVGLAPCVAPPFVAVAAAAAVWLFVASLGDADSDRGSTAAAPTGRRMGSR